MSKQELGPDEEWIVDESGNYVYEYENKRIARNSLDDLYIQFYCENPENGKTIALARAGYSGKNARQKAWRMHKRLLE